MTDKKKDYMDQLLHAVRQLSEKVEVSEKEDTLSFSFFNESFNQLEQITRLLHRLQSLQIDEMKQQMQKLLVLLSERAEPESEEHPVTEETVSVVEEISADETNPLMEESTQIEEIDEVRSSERVQLPGYRNPRLNEPLETEDSRFKQQQATSDESPGIPSLNDVIKTPPSVLDLKRGISLNDRFQFQRELFHNNREEMNGVMIRLNAFETYEKAEEYLKATMEWDFDAPVVLDFLRVIKKGFA
ncbi:hypothetical protein JS578_04465 [Dysgonomonadaceae bacterium zrk40]|nr:hypothetical protein JS578_04465 [Dysgonomonadaceae bacterium zrk40]